MSNIYIQEPATNGKVLLSTTVGDIEIELWSKEAPKACRNFVQLCLEKYYNKTIFHRLVKDFIVQGGDPTGTGEGGESVWGKPFKDEFHSRLRFVRRGLVAMANAGPHDNGSQFFFTLGATPELNNKHTVFGKVAGDTIYNMIKLGESQTDRQERPLHPHKIISTEVLVNPFDDIVPRVAAKREDEEADSKTKAKSEAKATKNFSLLSFGEEAEEEEEETNRASQAMKGKSKSSHDLLDDEKLSSVPAVDSKKRKHDDDDDDAVREERKEKQREEVRKKLQVGGGGDKSEKLHKNTAVLDGDESTDTQSSKVKDLKEESKRLLKELANSRKAKSAPVETKIDESVTDESDIVRKHKEDQIKYREKTKQKKGGEREQSTLALLARFQSKLSAANKLLGLVGADEDAEDEDAGKEEEEEESQAPGKTGAGGTDVDMSWMCHKLHFEGNQKKVIDANIAELDRYEIFDPRNPMNQRRRDKAKEEMSKSKGNRR